MNKSTQQAIEAGIRAFHLETLDKRMADLEEKQKRLELRLIELTKKLQGEDSRGN